HADEVKGKLGEKLRAGKEVALLSRDLGTIRRNAPLEVDFSACRWDGMADGTSLLEYYELKSLVRTMNALLGNGEMPKAAPAPRATGAAKRAAGKSAPAKTDAAAPMAGEDESLLPKAAPVAEEITLADEAALLKAAQALAAEKPEWAAIHQTEEEITLLTPAMQLWRMPILRDLMGLGLYEDQIFAALTPVLESIPVIIHGAKAFLHQLNRYRLPLPQVQRDTMIAAYLLHTALKGYDLAQVMTAESGDAPAAPTAWDVYSLSLRQTARIAARGMEALLNEMEQPLTRVLFEMEREGFLVDGEVLSDLGEWFTREVSECREAVYELTGVRDFNLNSPRQLGDVLFGRLGLPAPAKKGATGYSTSAEVLEGLLPYHPAIEPLLRYRKMAKLQSTYIDGLQKLRERDGRVRTTFDQTATVTGRISSMEPNLQNIPIRTEEGREIRRAFVAGEGNILLDADYSQIELRVLAHMSGDEAMCDAFNRNQDIHTRTAAEIHGVAME
ncbi:MAG: DNA polymerase, partial [Eubacteriales bacterium]|nr:DNA polymerase [Eubacteriales bacterium]